MLETMFRESKYIVNIEDEFNVVFICSCYIIIRNKYIPYYYDNKRYMFTFLELLNVTDKNFILSVSTFVKEIILLYS